MGTDDGDIRLNIPDASPDLLFDASRDVASRKEEKGGAGSRGDPLTLGTIVLAAISAGAAKQIAQVLITYIKRNPKYIVHVGTVKITKDYASRKDVNAINAIVEELSRKKSK